MALFFIWFPFVISGKTQKSCALGSLSELVDKNFYIEPNELVFGEFYV